MKYQYWDNTKGFHSVLLFECDAENITSADALFTQAIGTTPMKGMISVSIIKN